MPASMLRPCAWLFAGLLASLLLAPRAMAQSAVGHDDHVLVLGRVSDDPKSHYAQLKPLLDYLVPRMADVGIRSGRILMARDLQQMSSYLRRGRVDFINETAGNAAVLEERGAADAFLMVRRDGTTHYRSLFFVRKDSPIRDLGDLSGRSLALQSPYSTSAYFIPVSRLLERGSALELLLSPMDKPAPGRIGYLFARTELNITTWVEKGLVDAGVLSDLDWKDPRRVPPAFRADLRIIGSSDEVPRALMLTRRGLDPRVEARLRALLLAAADDPDAAEALREFMGTSAFVEIGPRDQAALRRLAKGVDRVRREAE